MTISMYDMLQEMKTGEVFSLTVVTFDRKRKQGGQVKEYAEARLYAPKSTRDRGASRREAFRRSIRRPNHGKFFTRNIQLMVNGHPTGEIRKIHPPLVTHFNGKTLMG